MAADQQDKLRSRKPEATSEAEREHAAEIKPGTKPAAAGNDRRGGRSERDAYRVAR